MAQKLFDVQISADELVDSLLNLSEREIVCLLDGGAEFSNSRFLFAGVSPVRIDEIDNAETGDILRFLDEKLAAPELFHFLTISYEFGLKLEKIPATGKKTEYFEEPLIFLAVFETIIVHDYAENKTFLLGNENRFDELETKIKKSVGAPHQTDNQEIISKSKVTVNFTKHEYLEKIEVIKEAIRRGDTYQTNLTQQFHAALAPGLAPRKIFRRLRSNHPAPFSAFLQRPRSTVVSASPEGFFQVQKPLIKHQNPLITTSPIKGTIRRGENDEEESRLRSTLLTSGKDRAENLMIVDLLRNDLGKICRFGSISAVKLCEIETLPTLHHLVSTVRGELNNGIKFSDILKAVFPCGSITGAPKISTMKIIDRLETAPRGLSMGAIGFSSGYFDKFTRENNRSSLARIISRIPSQNFSVAIRTMTIRGGEAVFNVGGGIVIDSVPENEYAEVLTKAKALFDAINAEF